MDDVKILGGTFAGYAGRIMTPDDINRLKWRHAPLGTVQVIVTIFGREIPVSIDWWLLEQAAPEGKS
jgi:transcription antitermination factor NusG